jgi:formate hydrogenlyase subunit 6/NADH:ubiquinone oxidoreductase subunit I
MAKAIYEKLREHLDSLPTGYPKTESGVELKILERLFTEEEAEMACQLKPVPESADQIAQRLERDPQKIGEILYRMSQKGLILRTKHKGVYQYMAMMFIVGIFEFQVNHLDRELAGLLEAYLNESMYKQIIRPQTPQLRVVPVEKSLTPAMEIRPYDEVRKIVLSQKSIALTDCICRQVSALNDHPCSKPMETCLLFGLMADYYIENGIGRRITPEEALVVLEKNEQAGLVASPANAQRAGGICNCCGCCCGVLKALKLHSHPSRQVKSNFFSQVDEDLCTGCETCLERCQMQAIVMEDDRARIDLNRCVGCGLCVTTCPTKALSLRQKDSQEVYVPPPKTFDTYLQIAKEMGKI